MFGVVVPHRRHADFQSRGELPLALLFKDLPKRSLPNLQYRAGLCITNQRKTPAKIAETRDHHPQQIIANNRMRSFSEKLGCEIGRRPIQQEVSVFMDQ